MKKQYLLPGLALLGGAGGMALRFWELKAAFDPATGLPLYGVPATWVLLAFTCAFVLLTFFLSRSVGGQDTEELPAETAFRCRTFPYLLLVFAAGLLVGAAAALYLKRGLSEPGTMHVLRLVFLPFGMASALSLLYIGASNYREEGKTAGSIALLLPGFAGCVWLMLCYQGWARNPFVLDYLFLLAAILSGLLAHYFIAAYSFAKPSPLPICLFCSLTIFASLIALVNSSALPERLMLLSQILYFSATLWAFCGNLAAHRPPAEEAQIEISPPGEATITPKEETP